MKIIAFLLVVSLPLFGAEPKVVSFDKLQHRGWLSYIPNQDTPFTGKAVSFYANGQKRHEANYKDGKLDWANDWYENGQKDTESNWKDGNWVVVIYNDDGAEVDRQTWMDGKLID